jgi:NAD+ synthase (glutamine-hydrolysing)
MPLSMIEQKSQIGFFRIASMTPEVKIADIDTNVDCIIKTFLSQQSEMPRILVTPELSITGYSCADLFYTDRIIELALAGLIRLKKETKNISTLILVGLPLNVNSRLYNVTAVISQGKILGIVPKSFIPNSGEFYERRWFSPANTLTTNSIKIDGDIIPIGTDLLFRDAEYPLFTLGIEICEDLWAVIPPSSQASLAGATVIANPSASNEIVGKAQYRRDLVIQQSARCNAAYIYCSAGPTESSADLVYSGHNIIAENGQLLTESPRFELNSTYTEADIDIQKLRFDRLKNNSIRDQRPATPYRIIEYKLSLWNGKNQNFKRHYSPTPFVPTTPNARQETCEEIFNIQTTALIRRILTVNPQHLILGVSGGLDSTLALLICHEVCKQLNKPLEFIKAINMPGFGTTERTKSNAEKLCESLDIPLYSIPIIDSVKLHLKDIDHSLDNQDITFENAQARERTQILMDIANQVNGIVIGTGNLSESALGWCTFNGDHMSMYHINSGIPKTLVQYLIQWCAEVKYESNTSTTLIDISNTPISPELLPLSNEGELLQKTEESIGLYELHDFFLYHFLRTGAKEQKILFLATIVFEKKYDRTQIIQTWNSFQIRFKQSQFKRNSMPDGPKVGSVALSPRSDWRMPSDL